MVDTADLKSATRKSVWVRVPLPPPISHNMKENKDYEKVAEEITTYLRNIGLLEKIQGCDDELCSVVLPIKHILSKNF